MCVIVTLDFISDCRFSSVIMGCATLDSIESGKQGTHAHNTRNIEC